MPSWLTRILSVILCVRALLLHSFSVIKLFIKCLVMILFKKAHYYLLIILHYMWLYDEYSVHEFNLDIFNIIIMIHKLRKDLGIFWSMSFILLITGQTIYFGTFSVSNSHQTDSIYTSLGCWLKTYIVTYIYSLLHI